MSAPRNALLEHPVLRVVVLFALARVPAAAVWLSIVLDVSHRSGSYARAGGAVAAYGVGVALLAPVVGRVADRRGARWVLRVSALVQLPALLLLSAAADGSGAALLVPAFLAGAAQPPVVACMRAGWSSLVPDVDRRRACFAFDSVLGEAVDLAAPLLAVALSVAAVSTGSLSVVAVASAVTTITFASVAPNVRRDAGHQAHGRLLTPRVLTVLLVIAVLTAALGAVEVGVVALADELGQRDLAGWLLAVFAAASIVGGIAHARRARALAPPVELLALLLPLCAGLVAVALLPHGGWWTTLLLAGAGLAVAPLVTVLLGVVQEVARPDAVTETFTFATTANFLGVSAGSFLAGAGIDQASSLPARGGTTALLISAALVAAAAVVVVALARWLPGAELVGAGPATAPGPEEDRDQLVQELESLWRQLERTGAENDACARELVRRRPDRVPA